MSRFNLIDEPWIPVRFLDGGRKELGIRETLLLSEKIASIEDQSPLVVASMHRFLIAILYRALEGPTDINQAKALFKTGLPEEKISEYLEKWRDRFWLFDEKFPFGQNPDVPKDELEPWMKLTAEYNATTNKVLFDHTDAKSPGARGPNKCARWLLSTMTFSIAGGRGYYPSPSPNAMMCIPLGRNFQKTLCYNLVPYPNREVMRTDSALWERGPTPLPIGSPKRQATGYADLYTWPARMILLEELPSGDVTSVRFIAGQGFENSQSSPDPMQPYKVSKEKGKLPVQFREGRGTWRDFDSLLPDGGELAPLTIQNSIRLAGGKVDDTPRSVLVLGLRYEPPSANVDFWRMERFSLPEALAGSHPVRMEIQRLLADADEAQKSMWLACRSYARDLLSRGDREPSSDDIRKFIKQMPVNECYWTVLERHFHEVLKEYTSDRDYEDIRCLWLKYVRNTLIAAWGQYSSSVSNGDVWNIRALVRAEAPVLRKASELNDEIVKLEPEKEGL